MNITTKPATAISTRSGKLFINLNGFFFYMLRNGKRVFSKGELNTGKLPDSQEWGWAQKNWDGKPKPEPLTPQIEGLAIKLAEKIKEDIFFGASREEKLEMQGAIKMRKSGVFAKVKESEKRASVTKTKTVFTPSHGERTFAENPKLMELKQKFGN